MRCRPPPPHNDRPPRPLPHPRPRRAARKRQGADELPDRDPPPGLRFRGLRDPDISVADPRSRTGRPAVAPGIRAGMDVAAMAAMSNRARFSAVALLLAGC